jgi:hypothetical protein
MAWCISKLELAMFKPLSAQRFNFPTSEFSPGPAPFLEWVETSWWSMLHINAKSVAAVL